MKSETKETILIVDDTSSNIDILIEILEQYDLIVSTSGEEALSIVENSKNSIDLILLDIMMPKMDGFSVCKILKQSPKHSSIPIIFITAKSDDESIEKAFMVGGVDYVAKPFKPVALLSRIKTHLKLSQHQRELAQKDKYMAISDLIWNISHQWKQPLSVITTAISGMMVQKELNSLSDREFNNLCQTSLNSCEYLTKTIDQFSSFIQNKDKSVIDLQEIINKNHFFLIDKEEEREIEFFIDIKPKTMCCINEVDFITIIKALVNNSKDALKNKSQKLIFLDGFELKDQIHLQITDNGGGIDPLIAQKVFEPYFTTEHKSLGKGMTLFKVYTLVQNSFNGDIKVFNKDFTFKGQNYKGACFEIIFPAV